MPRILIIDDDAHTRFQINEMLWNEPYELDEAPNGKLGLQKLRQQPADLVITEMVMPEMDGVEIIMALRRDFPDTKILAMSAGGIVTANQYLRLARSLGVDQVIAKPFTAMEMLQTIQVLLMLK